MEDRTALADDWTNTDGIPPSRCCGLVRSRPDPSLEACVVIPVRDEAAHLARTLAALAAQVELAGRPFDRRRFEIVILANNCRDASAAVARRFAQRHPGLRLHVVERQLPDADAHVGTARRLLMDEAARRLSAVGRPAGIIACTDGDSRVDPTWLAATIAEIANGADAVGGRILLDRDDTGPSINETRRYHLRDTAYRMLAAELTSLIDPEPADPWPRHHQHFGASLAVTADWYRRAGGLPRVECLEDVAFYERLRRIDAAFRHSPFVRVRTSARKAGRVALGLSTQLDEWAAMANENRPLLVDDAPLIESRAAKTRALRQLWHALRAGDDRHLPEAAQRVGLSPSEVRRAFAGVRGFGGAADRVDELLTHRAFVGPAPAPVPINDAIRRLRRRLADLRPSATSDRVAPPLPPLDDVEAEGCFSPMVDRREAEPSPRLADERVVDLVARERVVGNDRCPMDQDQVSPRFEPLGDRPPRPLEVAW